MFSVDLYILNESPHNSRTLFLVRIATCGATRARVDRLHYALIASGFAFLALMSSSSYACDTIPPPKLAAALTDHTATPPDLDIPMVFDHASTLDDVFIPASTSKSDEPDRDGIPPSPSSQQPQPRKLCVRHQRMADEGTNLRLQHVGFPRLYR